MIGAFAGIPALLDQPAALGQILKQTTSGKQGEYV
jgi:hypothetical protein